MLPNRPSQTTGPFLALSAIPLLASSCHPVIIGGVAAGAGGGGGGGTPVDAVTMTFDSYDKLVKPDGNLTLTVRLGGLTDRDRTLGFELDLDGVAGPETAIPVTTHPLSAKGGSTPAFTLVVPAATVPVDAYRLVGRVDNGKTTAVIEASCPVTVSNARSLPPSKWIHMRTSSDLVITRDIARLSNGDAVAVGAWNGTLTTPMGSVTTPSIAAFYVARVHEADGTIVAEQIVAPTDQGTTATAHGVAALPDDTVLVLGHFQGSVNFGNDANGGPRRLTATRRQVFVARYAFAGSTLQVVDVVGFGSDRNLVAGGIASLPGTSDAVVIGSFEGTIQFGATMPRTALGDSDGFVMRIDSSLVAQWVARFGGNGRDEVGNAVDAAIIGGEPRIVIAGRVNDDLAPVEVGSGDGSQSRHVTTVGGLDGLVAMYTQSGAVSWARRIGSPGREDATSVELAPNSGTVYVGGEFMGTVRFETSPPDPEPTLTSQAPQTATNGFVAKIDVGGRARWVAAMHSPAQARVFGVGLLGGALEEVAVAGSFEGSVTGGLETEMSPAKERSVGDKDVFVAHFAVGVPTRPEPGGRLMRLHRIGGSDNDDVDRAGALFTLSPRVLLLGLSLRSPSVCSLTSWNLQGDRTGAVLIRYEVDD